MNNFNPIEIGHKDIFNNFFKQDPPRTSELTFTNLFMWRVRYNTVWRSLKDCLLIIVRPKDEAPFGLPPVGLGDKTMALAELMDQLGELSSSPAVCRVSEDFIENHVDKSLYQVTEDRDNSDYIYLSRDLISLSGNKLHKKKNHVNKFIKNNKFEYRNLDTELVDCFLRMQEDWCELRNCVENPDLLAEDRAVYEALVNYEELDYSGGAILINDIVEAFALGEPINHDTAVIHIEKANQQIPGLYATINQRFCMNAWPDFQYVNREQDLGVEGLRKAKESYQPHHMIRKFIVTRK
jgi:uncharacterized protein